MKENYKKQISKKIFKNQFHLNFCPRLYIRRFRHDPTRFERSQQRVHRGGGIINVSYKFIYLTYI